MSDIGFTLSYLHLKNTVDALSEHIVEKAKYITSLEQRITELENVSSEHRDRCYGCIHKPLQGENYYEPCGECGRFYPDKYEIKKDMK